jgi:hypothetical protein
VLARYRVDFVDHADHVYDVMHFDRDTEEAAIKHAHRLEVPSIGVGFDVWQENRLVYRQRRN